ncbi:MAG TPA: choice-of-anchor D domain-containing protein, partial [Acidobacteriaceae bacterium]|nr:choice-of-anchor D domain-containing protein [Acidobacteriaceae bacterium]
TGTTLPQQGTGGSTADPSLSVSPSAVSFAAPVVVTGVSGAAQIVVVQNTGATSLALTAAVSGDFTIQNGCPATLLGGSSCQVLVSFAPSQPGARQGLLGIGGGSGFAPAYVALSGTATAILPANNGTLDLGQTLVGEPVVSWYKVHQSLASLTASVNSAAFGVAILEDAGFGHGTLPPASFAATATGTCNNCWIGIQFLSQSAGTEAATLALTTVANGNAYTLALSGTALPVSGLLLTPIAQDFGPVTVSSSTSPRLFTLANLLTPGTDVSISSVTASGDFATVPNRSGGQTCAATLAATASCFVEVVFAPSAVGQRTGTLTIVTDAGTVTAALSGNGLSDPGFAINPSELDFNNVPGTSATQQSIVLTNTGTTTLNVGAIVSSDASFIPSSNCSALAPGASCAIAVTFRPGFAPVSATLSIAVTATVNGQTTTVNYTATLSGLYTAEDAGLQIVPGVVNFGTTGVGALGVTRLFTVNNLTSKSVAVALTLPRQFPLATPSACTALAPFASCSFSVIYLPATAGAATGTIFAQGTPTDGSAPLQALGYVQGFGSAAGVLAITGNLIPHAALTFGQPNSGQSTQQTLTLTDTGSGPLTVRRITTEPPFFSATNCGTTLAASQSCTVTLTYSPVDQVASGGTSPLPRADAGTLVIESDAASSPDTIDLAGSVAPATAGASSNGALLAAFSLSQGALTFANTPVGSASAAQTVTLTNNGNTIVHVLNSTASTDFVQTDNCATLLPGDSCSYTVSFRPSNASTASIRMGTLEIATDASTALDFVSLFGTTGAAPLTLSPTALEFGTLNVGSASSLGVTVTNASSVPVTLSGLSASGDYTAASGTCPATGSQLAAGASCVLQVTFAPTAVGTRTGTLSLSSDAATLPLTVALTGIAVAAKLQITPGALAFDTVAVGSSANLSLTLLNTGSANVTGIVGQISGANIADFVITAQCSTPTLGPGQGCTMTVTFTPSAVGPRSATLTIVSSDPQSPAVIPLTGSGAGAGSFTLTVDGSSSASATVQPGSPATYALVVTPINGFTGPVALTCAPVTPGTYASCSLDPSTVSLNGSPQNSTVTINTITKASLDFQGKTVFLALLGLPLLLVPRARRMRRMFLLLLFGVFATAGTMGCGGNHGLLYTPAGGYQYQVTATSTSGTQIEQTVTLNLTVQ